MVRVIGEAAPLEDVSVVMDVSAVDIHCDCRLAERIKARPAPVQAKLCRDSMMSFCADGQEKPE